MEWNNIPLKVKLILSIIAGTFLILAVTTAVIVSTATSQQEQLAHHQSVEMTKSLTNRFDADMQGNQLIAKTLASSFVSYESGNSSEVINILYDILKNHPHLEGIYVVYEPNAFDGNDEKHIGERGYDITGRLSPYWFRENGSIVFDEEIGYELDDYDDYYQLPKTTKSDLILEPSYYKGELLISYISPILKDGEFTGVCGVDVALNYIDEDVSRVKVFDTGYAFATSNTGILLSHPVNKKWIGTRTLYDFDNPQISAMADDIKNGKSGNIKTIDPTTGKEVIMFYEPVKTGNFSFIVVVPEEEIFAGATTLRNQLIIISTIAIGFMGALAYFIALSITKPINNIVNNFKDISDDAVNGKLHTRADTDIMIDFKEIPLGLNDVLEALQKYAEDLSKANKDLKSLDRMKNEFLSNVGHELKTPLISIIGYNELMHDETLGPLTDQQKKAMEVVVRNSTRLRHLIDSLLYLSFEKEGKIKFAFNPIQVDEIIEKVIVQMVPQAKKKGLNIESSLPENLPLIKGDRDYLTQLLTNLIDNSTKFTPSGGLITVATYVDGNNLHIEVKDTGIGIPKELIPDLFKMFHQLDGSTTRRYEGTGLGMYISKSIVEKHNGDIWVESEEGVRTTVHVMLPK